MDGVGIMGWLTALRQNPWLAIRVSSLLLGSPREEKVCAACPTLVECRDLVVAFQDMLRQNAAEEFNSHAKESRYFVPT